MIKLSINQKYIIIIKEYTLRTDCPTTWSKNWQSEKEKEITEHK